MQWLFCSYRDQGLEFSHPLKAYRQTLLLAPLQLLVQDVEYSHNVPETTGRRRLEEHQVWISERVLPFDIDVAERY